MVPTSLLVGGCEMSQPTFDFQYIMMAIFKPISSQWFPFVPKSEQASRLRSGY